MKKDHGHIVVYVLQPRYLSLKRGETNSEKAPTKKLAAIV